MNEGGLMIWTLKVELLFGSSAEGECIRTIEIDSSSTLEDLHFAIQAAVEFDNDHMYEFYISRNERSRNRVNFDDENGKVYTSAIEDLYPLAKGMKLYYLFDYGDNWLFKISKSRKKPHEATEGIEYPRLVEKVGDNPEQYTVWDE